MKMESVNSKPSKKVMKRPALSSFKKALASSSKARSKRNPKEIQAKIEQKRRAAKKKAQQGVMYIGHLPHGFYESELREYFSQFGVVTGLLLARSERTGRPKGHAYLNFLDREVAEVAVQTMNNYLMCNRILKAHLLEPREGLKIKFPSKHQNPVTAETCVRAMNRQKLLEKRNSPHSESQHEQMIREQEKNLHKIQKKLTGLGIPEVEL